MPALSAAELCPTVVRAFEALALFGAARPAVSQIEVAEQLRISRAAARRLLRTLTHLGLVDEQPTGPRAWRYVPTPRVLEVGNAYLRTARPWERAGPYLAELAGRTGYSTAVGVLDGGEVVCVAAHARAAGLVQVRMYPGVRTGVEATALGWALLAGLPSTALAAWAPQARGLPAADSLQGQFAAAARGGWVAHGIWSLAVALGETGGALGLLGPAEQPSSTHTTSWLCDELAAAAASLTQALPAAAQTPDTGLLAALGPLELPAATTRTNPARPAAAAVAQPAQARR